MNDRATQHAELLLLCGKVRDDALSPKDAARLDALLQVSDEAKALYVQYMSLVSLLESRGVGQQDAPIASEAMDSIDHDVLAELVRMEALAETSPVDPSKRKQADPDEDEAKGDLGALSAHDLAAVGGYVMRRALTSRAAVFAYAAAIALLVGVLLVPWGEHEDPTPAPLAEQPADQPQNDNHVATLTRQRDAQWAEGALAPGSALAQGQRLTLTQGYAQITTNRGAVAILQAPATVELLNSDNAIRLHAGKLVGICETDSSKGFVVRTDQGDITDLGTEFGVEVRDNQVTATVFTGEIEVAAPGNEPQSLVTNQTARLFKDGSGIGVQVDHRVANGFARRMPGPANEDTIELTSLDQLDLTNVVKAYDFTGSISLASHGTSFTINGVTFTRHFWQDGQPFDGLTLVDQTPGNRPASTIDNQNSGAPNVTLGGSASDLVNFNEMLNWWNISGGQDHASLKLHVELPDGRYKVQLITGMNNFRENELFDIDAGDLGSGNEVALGEYIGGKGNYLITGTAVATGGTLDLKLFGTPGPGDGRPIVSGLIISTNQGGSE